MQVIYITCMAGTHINAHWMSDSKQGFGRSPKPRQGCTLHLLDGAMVKVLARTIDRCALRAMKLKCCKV